MNFKKYESIPLTMRPNSLEIPVTGFDMSQAGADAFNEVYFWCKENITNKIYRTRSGGISYTRDLFRLPCYDCRVSRGCIEITLLIAEGMFRFQIRSQIPDDREEFRVFGSQAFRELKRLLKLDGVDLDDYVIPNGPEVKKTIPSTYIQLRLPMIAGRTFEHCYHADWNSSFAAGLAHYHPEFAPTLNKIYDERKKRLVNKSILTHSIGYMQSEPCCGARWAHLSRDAIRYNNEIVEALSEKIIASGYYLLAWNTDGIWYQDLSGKGAYHDELEGTALGQWKTDHSDVKLRFKSAGCYEYIENGKYTPVVRGRTNLDLIRPRSQWQWGDIFTEVAAPILFQFDEERGVIKYAT